MGVYVDYIIEKNVPMQTRSHGGRYTELFRKMNPGDSFLCDYADGLKLYQAVAASRRSGATTIKLTTKKQDNGQLRVWLVSK